MTTGHDRTRAETILLLLMLACNGGGGGGGAGNPVEPNPAPVITSVEPADAAPGDPVTIRGENLAGGVTAVFFDDAAGLVISATATAVETVVPDVDEGERSIVVSVNGRTSARFGYRVAAVPPPTITAIQPATAHAGERIVILGSHLLGRSPAIVQIAGVGASVETAGPGRIVAIVPAVPVGVTNVQVTVGTKISNVFPLEIVRASPTILSVAPNPTRAGLWVTIRGAFLFGNEVAALVDGLSTEVRRSSDMSELGARIPEVVPGIHSLQVDVDGDLSAPFEFHVDDFDVSGVYDVQAVVVAAHAGPFGCLALLPEIGTRTNTQLELFDNRPDLIARLAPGVREYPGTVDWNGSIAAPPGGVLGPAQGIAGRVTRRLQDGRLEVDATIVHVIDLLCSYDTHVTGPRRDPEAPVPQP